MPKNGFGKDVDDVVVAFRPKVGVVELAKIYSYYK